LGLVSVRHAGGEIASANIQVQDVFIVGLGDSIASGDGNPDKPVRFDDRRSAVYGPPGARALTGYPARNGQWNTIGESAFHDQDSGWLSEPCHRSLYGHQFRAALQLAVEDPHRAITFASFACWGSSTVEGLMTRPYGSELTPGLPIVSQMTQAARLQCAGRNAVVMDWPRTYDMGGALPELAGLVGERCPPGDARPIDLLFVTIGGNDIGFAQVVANAVLADTSPLRQISGWLGRVTTAAAAQNALPGLVPSFKALNRAFHNVLNVPWRESSRIVLTAYPTIALQDNGLDACRSGREGFECDARIFARPAPRTR
jgi:hypothetical protein